MGHSLSKSSLRSGCAMSKNPSVTSLLSGISSCGEVPPEDAPTSYSALVQKASQANGAASSFTSGQQMLQPMVHAPSAPCLSTMAVQMVDPSAAILAAAKQHQQQPPLRPSYQPQQSTSSSRKAIGQTNVMAFATQKVQQIVPQWYIQEVVEFEPCDPMAQKHSLGTAKEASGLGGKSRRFEKTSCCAVFAPCLGEPFGECSPML